MPSRPITLEAVRRHNIQALEHEVTGFNDQPLPENFTRMFATHLRSKRCRRRKYIIDRDDYFTVTMFRMRVGDPNKEAVYWEFIQGLNDNQKRELASEVEWFKFKGWAPGEFKLCGAAAIEPVIIWQTTKSPDGLVKRTISCEPVNDEDTLQLNNRLMTRGNNLAEFLHYNPMVGLLAIKYLIPDIGEEWKRRLGLAGATPPHDHDNPMGEQAALVLASMMRNQILRDGAKFFERIEQLTTN